MRGRLAAVGLVTSSLALMMGAILAVNGARYGAPGVLGGLVLATFALATARVLLRRGAALATGETGAASARPDTT